MKKQVKGKSARATYAKEAVLTPPGTLVWPALHEMAENQFGAHQFVANLRWESEDDVQANTKVYDRFMDVVRAVAAERWKLSDSEAEAKLADGTIGSPFEAKAHEGSDYILLKAKINKVAADSDRRQREPQCFKLLGQEQVRVPKEEVKATFYPGAWVALKVVPYATQFTPDDADEVQKIVRSQLTTVLFLRDGQRLGSSSDGLTGEDVSSLAAEVEEQVA